jgi:hypothetical protein
MQISRQTVFVTGDEHPVNSAIIDRISIIDGRVFAFYTNVSNSYELGEPLNLALGPAATRLGDLIVALPGGELPFTVREFPTVIPLSDEQTT